MKYFDLEYNLRNNLKYAKRVAAKAQLYASAVKDFRRNHRKKAAVSVAMKELMQECGMNLGLFVPYYFPTYPRTKPLTFQDYPHCYSLMQFSPKANASLVLRGSRQVGKCQHSSTLITCIIPSESSRYQKLTAKDIFLKCKEVTSTS